jgi:uncharacterized membrane protein YecN with MAPEG domain
MAKSKTMRVLKLIDIEITPLYVALTALLMFVLAQLIGARRWTLRAGIGDAGDLKLALAIRRFGNLIEHAPILLVILFFLEVKGASDVFLHTFGIAFVLFRIMHPIGLFKDITVPTSQKVIRLIAVMGTYALYLVGAIKLLSYYF